MAARIRPSLDDIVIEIESDPIDPIAEEETEIEIVLEPNRRDFLLKRSYSFGFERSNLGSEQVLEAVTASPYRKSFWNKRNLVSQSPFTKQSVLIPILQEWNEIAVVSEAEEYKRILSAIRVERIFTAEQVVVCESDVHDQ